MKYLRFLAAAACAVTLGGGACSEAAPKQPEADAPKPALVLPDQFERTQDIAQFRGGVVVVLYGDRDGMPANKGLGEKLHARYGAAKAPAVKVLPVVCLGAMPEPLKRIVRNRVKKESPDSIVLLDFEGKTKGQLGLKEGVPNLAVLDAKGNVRMKHAGELDAAGYTKLLETIDALRKE